MREGSKKVLSRLPGAWEIARRTEEYAKGMLVPGTLFEELGWNYIGPIDGHDLPTLIATLRNMRDLKGPQFLHIVTKKGKGFAPAEVDPIGYHAITKLALDAPPLRRKSQRAEVFRCSANGCATWPPPTRAWWASPRR
jgi:1-deoxy-D-xylulose-5-phosphate synthase